MSDRVCLSARLGTRAEAQALALRVDGATEVWSLELDLEHVTARLLRCWWLTDDFHWQVSEGLGKVKGKVRVRLG